MGRSSEIPEAVKEKIVFYHKSGKGYKSISKITGMHRSTIRSIIRKWKTTGTLMNLPRSGRPVKISPGVELKIMNEIEKKPDITSKELQAFLALTKIKVHDSTIRRTLRKLGYVKEYAAQKPCIKEEIESPDFEENVLQKEELKGDFSV